MKARQFCSVCKQWLDMEVVPTGDGDEDDGVIWFRCPQCQGFLPKLGGGDLQPSTAEGAAAEPAPAAAAKDDDASAELPWDSPADMMAARQAGESTDEVLGKGRRGRRKAVIDGDEADDDDADDVTADELDDDPEDAETEAAVTSAPGGEPLAEYAALLAAADVSGAVPYRTNASYEVGQCVHHLAWDDCGIVVAKEALPGGRRVIKCYFASVGVVRLIVEGPA